MAQVQIVSRRDSLGGGSRVALALVATSRGDPAPISHTNQTPAARASPIATNLVCEWLVTDPDESTWVDELWGVSSLVISLRAFCPAVREGLA